MLISDVMTREGTIQGATRYGIVGAKNSVLSRSAFEETKKHLTEAAIAGERDPLNSVVENIILGQIIPVGTGMLHLKVKHSGGTPQEAPKIPDLPERKI